MHIQRALIKVTLIWKQLYITSSAVQSLFLQKETERKPILISIILIAMCRHMVVYMPPTAVGIASVTEAKHVF